jgi:hypothetical protein
MLSELFEQPLKIKVFSQMKIISKKLNEALVTEDALLKCGISRYKVY